MRLGGSAPVCGAIDAQRSRCPTWQANLRQIPALERSRLRSGAHGHSPSQSDLGYFAGSVRASRLCRLLPTCTSSAEHRHRGGAPRRGEAAHQPRQHRRAWENTVPVLDAAAAAHIPIRIGVNAGSLDSDACRAQATLRFPEKLAGIGTLSMWSYCRSQRLSTTWWFPRKGARCARPRCATYRLLAQRYARKCRCISASPRRARLFQGVIKSACGSGHLAGTGHRRHHAHLAHRRPCRRGARLLDAARARSTCAAATPS